MSIGADMEKRAFTSFCNTLKDALRKEHHHSPKSKCCLEDRAVLKTIWKVANLYESGEGA